MSPVWWYDCNDRHRCDRWHVTGDKWHMTSDKWNVIYDFLVHKSIQVPWPTDQVTCVGQWQAKVWPVNVTCDMGQVTHAMWHVTHDSWHMTSEFFFLHHFLWIFVGINSIISTCQESQCLPYAIFFVFATFKLNQPNKKGWCKVGKFQFSGMKLLQEMGQPSCFYITPTIGFNVFV